MKFQKAGGLTTRALSTLSVAESTGTGSELTTIPKSPALLIPLKPMEENIVTGMLRGEIGAAALEAITPAWSIPVREPPQARGVRLLHRWLKDGGSASRSDMTRAVALLAGGSPAERQTRLAHRILSTLAQYQLSYKNESIDATIQDDWMEALGHFPFYAVERACKAWLSDKATCKWRPQIGDIKDLAETYSWQYFKLLRAVE